jgi:hypothetical protein
MRQPSAQLLPAFVPVNEACRYLGGRRRQLISDLARAGELEMLGDEHRRLISVRSLERVAALPRPAERAPDRPNCPSVYGNNAIVALAIGRMLCTHFPAL